MWLNVCQGTYLGTLEDVNHLDLVGWINTARYKWAEIRGKEIKFRPATFYLGIADWLAREVEGQGREGEGENGEGRVKGEVGDFVDTSKDLSDAVGDEQRVVDPKRKSGSE